MPASRPHPAFASADRAAPASHTMRIGPVAALPAVMADLGVPPEPVFARAGISLRSFADPETRLPLRTLADLAHEAASVADCPHICLLIGDRCRLGSFGSIGSLMRHSATVGDALRSLVVKFHAHDWGAAPVLTRRPGSVVIIGYSVFRQDPTAVRYIYDAAAAVLHRVLMDLCGPEFRPRAVEFAYPRPPEVEAYRDFFRCTLKFDTPLTGVLFEQSWLAKPLAEAKPGVLRDFVELVAREETQHLPPFARRVELALQQMLLGGTATAPAIATLLGVSERTLRRRLDDEGETFRSLLNRRRFDLAQQLLRDTGLPVAEVATALQYNDANAFSRAFHAWACCTPTEWRRRVRSVVAAARLAGGSKKLVHHVPQPGSS